MPYTETVWVDDDGSGTTGTTVTAARMNNIENGIVGLDTRVHAPVSRATTGPLPANTYNNGTAGVGATLTASANGALVVDGGQPNPGDRILVKDEANNRVRGIYVVTQVGDASTPYILTRAIDFDEPSDTVAGSLVPVGNGGNTYTPGTIFALSGAVATFGTTPIGFASVSGWTTSGLDLQATNSGNVKAGGAFLGKAVTFSAYRGTAQALTNNAVNQVQLNSTEFDSHGWFSTSTYRYTPQQAGYYRISANVHCQPGLPAAAALAAFIRKNGSIAKQTQLESGGTTNWWGPNVSAVVYLNGTTDYVDLAVEPSGGNITAGGTNDSTSVYMQGEFIGTL